MFQKAAAQSVPAFARTKEGVADACKIVSAGFRAFKAVYAVFQVIMISSGTSRCKSFFVCNSSPTFAHNELSYEPEEGYHEQVSYPN